MTRARDENRSENRLLKALLVEAVLHRQKSSKETTLRDLHKLIDAPQPLALRVAHELEHEGILQVERNITDAFASVVSVVPPVASHFQRMRKAWDRPPE